VPTIQIEASRITGFPKIPFAVLRPDGNLDKFLETIEWVLSIIENDARPPK
jgi:hypothetical protein